jgi:gamma-glutamylcysteine synthetase
VAKRDRLPLRPRIVNDAQLAAYLNKSVSWLAENRLRLEAQGFPRRLPVIGGNDLEMVDQFLDRLHTTNTTTNGGSAVDVDGLWQGARGNGRQ